MTKILSMGLRQTDHSVEKRHSCRAASRPWNAARQRWHLRMGGSGCVKRRGRGVGGQPWSPGA